MPDEEAKKELPICINCGHTFHAKRCFVVFQSGRRYGQCRCEKGIRA